MAVDFHPIRSWGRSKKEKLSSVRNVYTGETEGRAAETPEAEGAAMSPVGAAQNTWPLGWGGMRTNDGAERGTARDINTPESSAVRPAAIEVDEDRHLAFEQIYAKYHEKIFNLILRVVGDRDDAEDLTVETFVNAYKAWGRFRGDSKVSTWLHQIAVNNCKNRFKQKDRQREREPISLDDSIETDSGELSREVADWRNAPERMLLDQEFSEQIQKAVEALPLEYRTVLILAQQDNHSYEEIAQITGLSIPAVKTRLHRARNRVRQRLEPYYRGWAGRNS